MKIKELTPLEALNLIALGQCKGKRKQYIGIVNKSLKALKIIKEKSVDVGFLQYCSNVETYNAYITEHAWTKHTKVLTQEEYDLLKEVL